MAAALDRRETEQMQAFHMILERSLIRILGLSQPVEDEGTGVLRLPEATEYVPASMVFAHHSVREYLVQRWKALQEQEKALTAPDMTADDMDDLFDSAEINELFEAGQIRHHDAELGGMAVRLGLLPGAPSDAAVQSFLGAFDLSPDPKTSTKNSDTMAVCAPSPPLQRPAFQLDEEPDLSTTEGIDALFERIEKAPEAARAALQSVMSPEQMRRVGVLPGPPPLRLDDDEG